MCTLVHPINTNQRVHNLGFSAGDDDRGMPMLKHGCDPGKNPGNCTGQKDGLYYKVYGGMCSLYGCFNGTLTTLGGDLPPLYIPDEHQATLYVCRVSSGGIDPATGLCKEGADCPEDTTACESIQNTFLNELRNENRVVVF